MMKAGLLICDHVKEEYQSEFGDYSDMFKSLFPDFSWIYYDCINGIFPDNLNECQVYFATGSKHSVYDDIPWIHELKNVIRRIFEAKAKFIGFCFGHQLIGESLGGKVGKSPNGWCVGVHYFHIYGKEDWMIPFQEELGLLMMCQDQILELPENSKVIGGSDLCTNGIITVGDHFLGIQGHPEFTKAYDELLMKTRMNRMGDEVALKGIVSLKKKIDVELIKTWILNFLNVK